MSQVISKRDKGKVFRFHILCMSKYIILIQIILLHPCTSASSEHSYSYLRVNKTYLRNIMGNQSLHALTLFNF